MYGNLETHVGLARKVPPPSLNDRYKKAMNHLQLTNQVCADTQHAQNQGLHGA